MSKAVKISALGSLQAKDTILSESHAVSSSSRGRPGSNDNNQDHRASSACDVFSAFPIVSHVSHTKA